MVINKRFSKQLNSILIALSIFGIGASLISINPALADYGGGSASISGSVVSVPSCSYSISGVSSSIALTANNQYNPDSASGSTVLSGSDSNIVISGFPGTINTPCSFYGAVPSSPKMKVNLSNNPSWSGTCLGCSNSYNISWSVNSSTPITVTPSQSSAGGAGTTSDCSSSGVALTAATLSSATSANLITISGSTPKQCDANMTISTPMPSGINNPAGQRTYTVTGPTVTYTYSGS